MCIHAYSTFACFTSTRSSHLLHIHKIFTLHNLPPFEGIIIVELRFVPSCRMALVDRMSASVGVVGSIHVAWEIYRSFRTFCLVVGFTFRKFRHDSGDYLFAFSWCQNPLVGFPKYLFWQKFAKLYILISDFRAKNSNEILLQLQFQLRMRLPEIVYIKM